jgi:hypothetical protein
MSNSDDWPPDPTTINLDNSQWLTIAQAAAAARVSEKTIRRWVRERDIAVFLPSGRAWIHRGRLFRPQQQNGQKCPEMSSRHFPD